MRSAARREAFYRIEIAAQGMRGRQRIQHQLGVGTDDHQQIVEVMGHASGESADRIHLLGLLQLIFQPPPVGDVPIVGDKMRDPAFTVAQASYGFLGDENVPVLFAVHHGAAEHIAGENGLPHLFVEFRILLSGFQHPRVLAH